MILDFTWLLISSLIGWFVFGKKLEEKPRINSTTVCSLVSLFLGFKLLMRASHLTNYSYGKSLLYGMIGGLIVLLAAWGFRLLLEPKKETKGKDMKNNYSAGERLK